MDDRMSVLLYWFFWSVMSRSGCFYYAHAIGHAGL